MRRLPALLAAAALLAGCAAPTLDGEAAAARLGARGSFALDVADPADVPAPAPTAPLPRRLGVAPPVGLDAQGGAPGGVFGAWTAAEAERWRAFGRAAREDGLVDEVELLPRLLFAGDAPRGSLLDAARTAAAREGFEGVVLCDALLQEERYATWLALLDLTLVGMWLFDGHAWASLVALEGLVVGVEDGRLYHSAERVGASGERRAPWMGLEEAAQEARQAARLAALDALLADLRARLERGAARTGAAAPDSAMGRSER